MKKSNLTLILAVIFYLGSFISYSQNDTITVFLIGDSTMSDKMISAYPETGWGMPFKDYFDSTVVVDNRAKNGRSTSSFINEGRWESVMKVLHDGDYVLIQFGHNDEIPTKGTYTPPQTFKENLVNYVTDVQEKGANPILLTPVTRRKFDNSGNVVETHPLYADLVKEVAKQTEIPLIDLNALSKQLIQNLGVEKSKFLWLHLAEGQNPHYPKGRQDDTHFNELGARRIAELVLGEIEQLKLPLRNQISNSR